MALGIIPGDPYLAAKAFANLKVDLDEERATRLAAQVEVNVLTRAVKELKISTDRFATQISTLEGKVKHLEDKVEDGMKEVQT
jgi:outer membrane murein-binding lipoprotein Lpp